MTSDLIVNSGHVSLQGIMNRLNSGLFREISFSNTICLTSVMPQLGVDSNLIPLYIAQ